MRFCKFVHSSVEHLTVSINITAQTVTSDKDIIIVIPCIERGRYRIGNGIQTGCVNHGRFVAETGLRKMVIHGRFSERDAAVQLMWLAGEAYVECTQMHWPRTERRAFVNEVCMFQSSVTCNAFLWVSQQFRLRCSTTTIFVYLVTCNLASKQYNWCIQIILLLLLVIRCTSAFKLFLNCSSMAFTLLS